MSAAMRQQGLAVGLHLARTDTRQWAARTLAAQVHSHDRQPPRLTRRGQPTGAPVQADGPNQTWASDITCVRKRSGWLYLTAMLDLFSREVVGWAMAASEPAQMACETLHMAIASRRPQLGLLMHSDRGSQYASQLHTGLLERHGLACKMERVRARDYANHVEAKADIADYIVGFYAPFGLHSTLGYLSPNYYELQQAATTS